MIDSLRNINKESANTVLFNGSTTHYPGAALIMALPGRWKKQIYRTEPVDSAAGNAEAGALEKKDSPTPENSNSVSNEINQTASNRLQDIRAKHRLRLQNKIGVPPLILTSPTTQTNNNSTSNNNNNYNYEKGSATGGASKFASSSKLNDSDSETNSINSIPSATNMRNQSFQTTAGWTPSNTESLVETKVPAADGVSSKYTMEPLEMDEAAKNEKKNKKKTTREPRDIVGLLYRFYNILINFLNRRGVLPSILVILYVLSVCLGLFVDGAVIGVQIVSSFITIVMGMMLHRVAAPFLGKILTNFFVFGSTIKKYLLNLFIKLFFFFPASIRSNLYYSGRISIFFYVEFNTRYIQRCTNNTSTNRSMLLERSSISCECNMAYSCYSSTTTKWISFT